MFGVAMKSNLVPQYHMNVFLQENVRDRIYLQEWNVILWVIWYNHFREGLGWLKYDKIVVVLFWGHVRTEDKLLEKTEVFVLETTIEEQNNV